MGTWMYHPTYIIGVSTKDREEGTTIHQSIIWVKKKPKSCEEQPVAYYGLLPFCQYLARGKITYVCPYVTRQD